ncbi:NeuD/PglB/VioB family sugar acetyltransferase [Capnocytophaga sputigena]|jgi:sugar O-acyltransferase, sialic acid O-acetyltransferase neuD family|uniref:NeuD/PglB/VioB family sugar acetyltransferase n=1 Tax=Capnocytophaga sputigena TaxID=1019 RepID=UPI0028D0409E|nr:NeuD/PglB/VioB family sugar acetyltransferase [Capnocytophaga sputigena]
MKEKNNKPNIILIGGGGHCLSVIDVVEQEDKYNIKGILDDTKKGDVLGYPILGNRDLVRELSTEGMFFLITIGQIKSSSTREDIALLLDSCKANLATVISPLAYVSKHATIGKGSVIMHNAIINAKAKVGKHCIINTKANIEHNVQIGDFCHISTCATVNGDTIVGKRTFIGSNATISNNITIVEKSIISAGNFIKR